MTFAKTFGQRHVLRFLSSHIDLSGCRITAASPVGLRVTDGVHKLCLKSTDGCIQREDDPNSVAPEPIEPYRGMDLDPCVERSTCARCQVCTQVSVGRLYPYWVSAALLALFIYKYCPRGRKELYGRSPCFRSGDQ